MKFDDYGISVAVSFIILISSIFYNLAVMITQTSLEYSPYTPSQRAVVAGSSVIPIGHEDSVWAVEKRPISSSSGK